MSNNLDKGNRFRDDVAVLLRAAHYYNVETEKRLGSKKIDIYIEEKSLGSVRKIGVECKNYERPLTKEYISSKIYPDYNVLLQNHQLDQVLILAKHDLNADAKTFVKDAPCFNFMTFTELQNQLMDFSAYVMGISAQYQEGGLNEYYIRPLFDENNDLEERIESWLSSNSSRPIAVLAGYGMGKTSFARHIAHKVATTSDIEGNARIPILIKLGDISSEQGLEGLIGKILAANSVVKNYHFDIFMELNRRGRFFVILDGFDEMKHTMSWSQFKYNFSQLNRLVVENSKVLLLGRPSAFLSDAEHYFVLKGIRMLPNREIREPGWPSYEEINLIPFTETSAHEFVEKYINFAYRLNKALGSYVGGDGYLSERLTEIKSTDFSELISRPVQAKMLTDIAIDPSVHLHAFTRYELYNLFITRIIEREQEKVSRQHFSHSQRRDFVCQVSWWLWTKSGLSGFPSDEIPREIVSHYIDEEDHDLEDVKRDLLAGSILERKAGDRFFFPHRSFQEFLVAEYIQKSEWHGNEIINISNALNPEVINFIKESNKYEPIISLFHELNDAYGTLTISFLDLMAWSLVCAEYDTGTSANASDNPWGIIVKVLTIFEKEQEGLERAVNYAVKSFTNVTHILSKAMCLICLFIIAEAAEDEQKEVTYRYLAALILKEAIPSIEKVAHQPSLDRHAVLAGKDNIFMDLVIDSFTRYTPKGRNITNNEIIISLDLSSLYTHIEKLLSNKYELGELKDSLTLDTIQLSASSLSQVNDLFSTGKKGALIAAFFKKYGNPKSLVKVQSKHSGGLLLMKSEVSYPSKFPEWARSKLDEE